MIPLLRGPRFGGALDDAARMFCEAFDLKLTPEKFVERLGFPWDFYGKTLGKSGKWGNTLENLGFFLGTLMNLTRTT